jgi:hypothetical protein
MYQRPKFCKFNTDDMLYQQRRLFSGIAILNSDLDAIIWGVQKIAESDS